MLNITETNNKSTIGISDCSTIEMVRMINEEDKSVAFSVETELERIAAAIDAAAPRLLKGGRLFYIGAGTSGRLGVLDASECHATFGVPTTMVQAIVAGGIEGVTNAANGDEDDFISGEKDIAAKSITNKDVIVGITASGRTPYVHGAIMRGKKECCLTIGVCNNYDTSLSKVADITISPVTGPEAIQGSTRLKAGTAQKMVLNMLSTGIKIRLGKTYENLMVDFLPNNDKLRDRAIRVVMQVTGIKREYAEKLLEETGYHIKSAIKITGGISNELCPRD